jgi:amino acid transporter
VPPTNASNSEDSLLPNQLGTGDLTASTIANIGPGIDFYFGFGIILATAGVGAPLTIVAAGIAVLFLASTVSEFTKVRPSAGSFIAYVEAGFGRRAGDVTALLVTVGYIVAMTGVLAVSGGFLVQAIGHYSGLWIPWVVPTILISLAALMLMVRGVRLSTRVVAIALVVQIAIMVVACTIILVDYRSHLSLAPFTWSHVKDGLAGLSAGFPLALYMFIGWENGLALAEEAKDPRRSVPRSLFLALFVSAILFIFFAYATITSFDYDVHGVTPSSIPFVVAATKALGPFAFLVWISGIVSVLATLLSGTTSQARMIYDGGREGFLPHKLGKVNARYETPSRALGLIIFAGLGIIALWGLAHWATGSSGALSSVGLYAECSTFGTIVILAVYALTNVALPFFVWHQERASFSWPRHVVVPALGVAALIIPFVELFQPGQPAPYSAFPYVAVGVVALCVFYVLVRSRFSSRVSG